jgi:hypothetical protein
MSQNLHTRVAKLEQRRGPRRQYVVRVSDPKDARGSRRDCIGRQARCGAAA